MADLVSTLSYPAPRLETVTLWTSSSTDLIALPPNAFSGHLPRLRVLDLGIIPIGLGSEILNTRSLEELSTIVSTTVMGKAFQSVVHSLASVLSKLPNLRVLRLRTDHQPLTDNFQRPAPVHLPKLRLLCISDSITRCLAVLDTLRVPPTCTLDISCHLDDSSDDATQSQLIPALLHIGAHLRCDPSLSPIQTFSAEITNDFLSLSGWRCVPKEMRTQGEPWVLQRYEAAFVLKMEISLIEIDMNALWAEVQVVLPLQDARYMSIRGFGVDDYRGSLNEGWTNDFSSFKAVTHCCICAPLPDFSLDLPSLLKRSTLCNPSQLQLPSLTSLCIRSGLELRRTHELQYPNQSPERLRFGWTAWQNSLYEALEVRRTNGFGVEKLALECWVADAELKRRLRSVVPTVVFSDCKRMDDLWPIEDNPELDE